jgi:hypothetical protein
MNEESLQVLEKVKIRRVYDETLGKWWFSVVDVVAVLIDQPDFQRARKYWW